MYRRVIKKINDVRRTKIRMERKQGMIQKEYNKNIFKLGRYTCISKDTVENEDIHDKV